MLHIKNRKDPFGFRQEIVLTWFAIVNRQE